MNSTAPPGQKLTKWLQGRERIVTGISAPLGFFVLALLIVEVFLLGAGSLFNLPTDTRIHLAYVAVMLFILVIGVVTFLVIKYPQNLVFTERSHLQWAGLQMYGDKAHPMPPELLENALLTGPPEPPVGQPDTPDTERAQ